MLSKASTYSSASYFTVILSDDIGAGCAYGDLNANANIFPTHTEASRVITQQLEYFLLPSSMPLACIFIFVLIQNEAKNQSASLRCFSPPAHIKSQVASFCCTKPLCLRLGGANRKLQLGLFDLPILVSSSVLFKSQ